jgi:hypothetical protein
VSRAEDSANTTNAPHRRPVATAVGIAALAIGVILILVLFWQYIGVYFVLFRQLDPEADGARYLVTAALAVGVPIAAAIIGWARRILFLFGWGIALAIVALVAAFVLQVPAGRFWIGG